MGSLTHHWGDTHLVKLVKKPKSTPLPGDSAFELNNSLVKKRPLLPQKPEVLVVRVYFLHSSNQAIHALKLWTILTSLQSDQFFDKL